MDKKIQGIYKIRNLLNSKIYIGQSTNINNRFRVHRFKINKNIKHPLQSAFKKYGIDNFEFNIIERVADINKLNEREQYWLDHYQSYLPENGYNLSPSATSTKGYSLTDKTKSLMSLVRKGKPSGHKGKKHTEDSKLKISLSSKGKLKSEEHRKNMSISRKGKKHSKESKEKMSKSKTGKNHTEKTKNKISLIMTGKKRGNYKKKTN